MDLVSGYKGVVGLMFGNENSGSNEDSYVECLLDRISNGALAEDRRNAIAELQSVVAESRAAQLAFGAMGFPVLLSVLKEERDDVEMVRGTLKTLVSALSPIAHAKGPPNEVQPALMNTDLLSREAESISLLLSLLSEEHIYVRYYTLRLLTALLTNSRNRLQEAILTTPRGITRLMDMLMDRKVIRNQALLLFTHLTREAELSYLPLMVIFIYVGKSFVKSLGFNFNPNTAVTCNVRKFKKLWSWKALLTRFLVLLKRKEVQKVVLWCSMLVLALTLGENDGDPETCCRAASVLSHVLKDNIRCKEKALRIELEAPMLSLGASELLLHRTMKYLAVGGEEVILKLLVTWLFDYPSAVQCLLDSRPHLTYLLELVSNPNTVVSTRGLAAVLLGECVIYNKSADAGKDAFSIVDAISQKIGLASYLLQFDDMQKSFLFSSAKPAGPHKPLTRSAAASMAEIEDVNDIEATDQWIKEHPILASIFDSEFVNFIKSLEANIRESILEIYSHPKSKVAVVPAELEQKSGETDADYNKRLKAVVGKQYSEIQDLLNRVATLAGDSSKTGGAGGSSHTEHRVNGSSERESEALRSDLQVLSQQLEMLKMEKSQTESDLKSLSDAYNSLEQANYHLENEIKALKAGGAMPFPDVESIKAEAREESQKESEAELNDLLVCLGQEQSKVVKLSARLLELGEDVEQLLEGIGDDIEVPEEDEEDED